MSNVEYNQNNQKTLGAIHGWGQCRTGKECSFQRYSKELMFLLFEFIFFHPRNHNGKLLFYLIGYQ